MIEIRINKDIGSYEAKFIGPFTMRQTLCILAAAPICWGIYSKVTPILGGDIAGFLVLFPAALCWLIGWYKPYGMHTEKPVSTISTPIRDVKTLSEAARPSKNASLSPALTFQSMLVEYPPLEVSAAIFVQLLNLEILFAALS